jgi:RNA recognition motif-containing protein
MLYEGTRSKGEGIVQFAQTEEAQTAGERFTGYQYGGRPLGELLLSLLPLLPSPSFTLSSLNDSE